MKYVGHILCSVVSTILPKFKFLCKSISLCASLVYTFPFTFNKY